ncbi:tRNA 2-thiouridine(34) synthase MnmA [Fulvivirgaceae bacterium LMO-SS25]
MRVVVGLSGGVDSSVTAHLLQEQGHEVIGVYMRNWYDESVTINNECPWIEDSADAMAVAEHLGIPFYNLDLSKEYKERIVDYMFAEYEKGRTPNPDVLCNREIKFDTFLKAALKLKADAVATGHYCQKDTIEVNGKTVYRLLAGADANKDQSYFLCQLSQEQLSKALFPIGHLQKREVREIATEIGLPVADKKDSQGLCFVGKIRLPEFLQQQLAPKKGTIVEIPESAQPILHLADSLSQANGKEKLSLLSTSVHFSPADGEIVGEHNGAHFFTVGQRKGLQVGGKKEPLFVLEKDTVNNILYTGQGAEHPGLQRGGLFVKKEHIHWVREDMQMKENEQKEFMVRYRYRQALISATLHREAEGLYVIFEKPQTGIASGQFVAWYDGNELIGSGEIH